MIVWCHSFVPPPYQGGAGGGCRCLFCPIDACDAPSLRRPTTLLAAHVSPRTRRAAPPFSTQPRPGESLARPHPRRNLRRIEDSMTVTSDHRTRSTRSSGEYPALDTREPPAPRPSHCAEDATRVQESSWPTDPLGEHPPVSPEEIDPRYMDPFDTPIDYISHP